MKITTTTYFTEYLKKTAFDIEVIFNKIDFSDDAIDVEYRIQSSAVFSSNIEGNTIDLNSFMNTKMIAETFKPQKQIQEIEDLINAYSFAKENKLNEENLLKVHEILSDKLLLKGKRGKYRSNKMGVFDSGGLVYLAIEPEYVAKEMAIFFEDINKLLLKQLSIEQLFYHAALIHLKFVHIHPMWDGNGRTARLLEKWFLSKKINSRAWKIQSEKYYKENITTYYKAINLGVNYYELNYDNCLPFLLLLPKALYQEKIS